MGQYFFNGTLRIYVVEAYYIITKCSLCNQSHGWQLYKHKWDSLKIEN